VNYFTACERCGDRFESKPGKRFCKEGCRKAYNKKATRAAVSSGGVTASQGYERIRKLLEDNDIPGDAIGEVKTIRLNEWTALAKGEMVFDESGKGHREATREVPMKSASILLSPSWAEGPKWPVVQSAPLNVKPLKSRAKKRPSVGWKTALILPDPQVGYRRDIQTGELDPFHDLRAIDVANQILADVIPDTVILLGDCLDFAPFGRFVQEPSFALTIQPAINYMGAWLEQMRFTLPDADMRFIEGNHDLRLQTSIINNAAAAFGIKAANKPDSWPVLSVPNLLNLDALNIQYVSGYPAGATYLNNQLACVHGLKVKSAGSTAAQVIDDERVSTIFGHVHRIETVYKTRNSRGKPKFSMAHTPGCLARIDGGVPSTKSGIDPHGHPVKSFENWQQSVSLVRYEEGDGRFAIESIPIWEGWALYNAKEYRSQVDMKGMAV